ncbi:hypothetical protein BJY01DRAFT_210996 [Aspergillus pseudoustus]|uniref:Uncharacterized protein n=1 Tax=Aspergillus pseudoustus TaxID=1810923 RepID=A0ABR4KD75_9EURO
MHLRKIVSHIFGRNKNTTKRIPGEIWEVYCRKHYQRTRYRSGADEDKDGVNNRGKTWAGEQCNFVVDALRRMGRLSRTLRLSGFRVSLRKRELERIEGGIRLVVRPKPTAPASGSGGGTASGSGAGAGAGTSQPSSGPCSSSTSADTTPASNSSTKPKKKAKQKRPAVPAPVPEWLILYVTQHEDQVLSFDKVTNLVRRIQAHIETVVLGPNQEVRFPDIEFLPVFGDADSLSLTSSSGTGGSGAPGSDQGSGESAGSDRGRGRRPHSGAFSGFTKTRKSS